MKLPAAWKVGVLSALYFAQGLPFGFQSTALPLYLGELDLSYTQIGFARALSAPWMFKFLWAPLVDRFGSRRRWIIGAQLLLSATCVFVSFFPLRHETLAPVLACILAMNFFAATQDIAVDGFAVDLLSARELGAGNAAQVVGYKVGVLTGGSLLVALVAAPATRAALEHLLSRGDLGPPGAAGLSPAHGWSLLFWAMALVCLMTMTMVFFVREPAPVARGAEEGRVSWRELVAKLKASALTRGAGWLLLGVATYKMGETLADAMFGVWLTREHAIPKETVAVWLGGWGMGASVLGSFAGGYLATRFRATRAVFLAGVLRLLPLIAQWALTAGLIEVSRETIVPITIAEHLFGGALTTTMFALMMASVDRRIGATHYTLLASVEVLGKSLPGLLSGVLADALGVAPTFALAVVLSAAFLVVCRKLPEPPLRAS